MIWPRPARARAGRGGSLGLGEVVAEQAAGVEWVGGEEMEDAEESLHPDHAAEQGGGADEG